MLVLWKIGSCHKGPEAVTKVFFKKVVFKYFAKFTGKQLRQIFVQCYENILQKLLYALPNERLRKLGNI